MKKKTTKKPSKKSNKKKTYVVIVLDKSGSMSSIHTETVEGLNKQFTALKESAEFGGDTLVSLIQFDDQIEVVFDGVNPYEVKNFKMNDFCPQGMTSLFDGIWSAINLLKLKDETDDTAFLVCTISDGGENSSKEVSQLMLSNEIEKLQNTGKWTFTYLLANQSIEQAIATFKSPVNNITVWNNTSVGAGAAYTCNSANIGTYMKSTRGLGLTATADFYSDSDKTLLSTTK
jgi:hypothetical protein